MMQQQIHTAKQQPDISRKQRWQRLTVTLVLLVALGATLWILKSQGVLPPGWLNNLPWVIVTVLGLVMVWAILWLLKDRGFLRGSWVKIALRLIQLIGAIGILGFCVWAIFTGVWASCSSSHDDCWANPTNRLTILFTIFFPVCVFVLVLLQVYLAYRQVDLMISPPGPPETASGANSSSESDDTQAPQLVSGPLIPARSLVTLPPLTDPRIIEQREMLVRGVYAQLSDQLTNALVLTGIGGAGKSTLAALVYRYEEKQRALKQSHFLADPLWLTISESVTMTELTSVLLELLDTPVPDIEKLPPPQQALALFNALSATDTPRLIVLDQFETLLNSYTGQILPERLGVGEWLEALNSRPSSCRMLFTSRLWPRSTHPYGRARLQEYPLVRLSVDEGMALLRKQGVAGSQATETELRTAVERCQGHPLSLALLASILQNNRNLNLRVLLTDPLYSQLWRGEIARGLLDYIYQQQLNEVQRRLLCAFSVYREAVPLQAAQALLTESPQEVLEAYEILRTQHLLQDAGELLYRLHPIVVEYAWSHFDGSSEQANQQALHVAHAGAAEYYLQIAKSCLPRENRRRVMDVQPIIEAIWQWCQADRWKDAYDLMNRERIFDDVNRWGGNVLLLELCLLFFPLEKWHPELLDEALLYSRVAYIYNALGQKQEALRYYEQALAICKEVGDRGGEGTALHNIGMIYFQREQYDVALACFWLARLLYLNVQSPSDGEDEEQMIGAIFQKVGEQQSVRLLTQVKTRAAEIIEQALQSGWK